MIERLLVKELLNFDNVLLDFDDSLVVLTGPSGAGKSVLMGALLSSFGHTLPTYALSCETTLSKPRLMKSELYDLDDVLIVKSLKKEKVRYYLNDQNIPRKSLEELFAPYVHYLSVRDKKGIDSQALLEMIDRGIDDTDYSMLQKNLKDTYYGLKKAQKELEDICAVESKIADMQEIARFEVEKIDNINPKIGEDENLLVVKQQLSRIDKLKATINSVETVFDVEQRVYDFYNLTDKSSELFGDAMNQLRIDIDEALSRNLELEDIDVEEVLNRLEALNGLKNRYGSIEEVLAYRDKKRQELDGYEHIEQDKTHLQHFIEEQREVLDVLCADVSKRRAKEIESFKNRLDGLLEELKLPCATIQIIQSEPTASGYDTIHLSLGDSKISTLSGGEFNRLRLALLMASSENSTQKNGIVVLDEIDANVSGDESIAIANMLQRLSKNYQIFAISHQPHLASKAHQHILVTKEGEKSKAIPLDKQARVEEIARIVDGKEATLEALDFAKKLLA